MTLPLPGKGERGEDWRANLPLSDEEGEIERVREDVVVDEVREEADKMEEGVGGPQRSCEVTWRRGGLKGSSIHSPVSSCLY